MILDEIIEKRKIQLAAEKSRISLEEQKKLADIAPAPKGFGRALRANGLSVISEVKKLPPQRDLSSLILTPLRSQLHMKRQALRQYHALPRSITSKAPPNICGK